MKESFMSKGSTDDITRRKLAMIAEALKAVNGMDEKAKPKRETVSLEEALKAEMLVNQALINLLVNKGLISQEELLEEIKALRKAKS